MADSVTSFSGIPDTAYLQPCREIMDEPQSEALALPTLASQYHALTTPLPLAGARALRLVDGKLAIVQALRAEAPWCEPAIACIERQLHLQLWAGRPWIAFRPLLIVGPPGAGKSHFARLLADQAGCGRAVLDFAGISDARTIEGVPRGWTNTQPCFPALTMNQCRSANPLIVIEELEKAGGSRVNGDPIAVLLAMTERATAARYYDKCLMSEIDLSQVSWVFTANSLSGLPPPLLSRLDIVEVTGPSPHHFDGLVVAIQRSLARAWALGPSDLPEIHPHAQEVIRRRFVRHRSARLLARDIEAVLAAGVVMLNRSSH